MLISIEGLVFNTELLQERASRKKWPRLGAVSSFMPSLPSIPDTAKIKLLQCLGKERLGLRDNTTSKKPSKKPGPPKGTDGSSSKLPFFRCDVRYHRILRGIRRSIYVLD